MFSCDVDSFDFKSPVADQIINTVMTKLDKPGKGIILMHDLQKHTATPCRRCCAASRPAATRSCR